MRNGGDRYIIIESVSSYRLLPFIVREFSSGRQVREPLRINRTLQSLTTLAALLGCGLFVTKPAQAECARYVTYHDQNSNISGRLELVNFGVPKSTPRNDAPVDRPARPRPCSGALCSGSPAVPWAPIHTIPERVNQWAFLDTIIDASRSVHEPLAHSSSNLIPTSYVDSIFHPPRPR